MTERKEQFTKGPWHIGHNQIGLSGVIDDNDNPILSDLINIHRDHQAAANFALIAAAPELYEALTMAEWAMGDLDVDFCPVCFVSKPNHADDCKLARALAKARGEQ